MNRRERKQDQLALMEQEFERIQKHHSEELNNLGESIRVNIIMPACKRLKLNFISGMGTFFFSDEDDHNIADCDEALDLGLEILCPIFKLLNQEVAHNDYLGFYVGDVRWVK